MSAGPPPRRDSGSRVAIVGAGPCGLACARELLRLGLDDFTVFERWEAPGGNAASVVDPAGFTWDLGGHVVFSHYGEFDRLLEELLGDEVHEHERSSYIHADGRWVPYPYQNNLRHLDPQTTLECLQGLIEAPGASARVDFGSWLDGTFGSGIARHFMRPYNEKVWATPLEQMNATWIAERVSVVDAARALRNVVLGLDDPAWGPNSTFRFPAVGGTGEIYRRLAATLGGHVRYGSELVGVDPTARRLRFADGGEHGYDVLVSTMPLDRLVAVTDGAPSALREAAGALEHTGVWMVGVGYERPLADERCWLYFPEPAVPFYRVTNFARYAAANVPRSDTARYCSFLTETAYSRHRHVEPEALAEQVRRGLVQVGLVDADAPVASTHLVDIDYAYPVPTLRRDAALRTIQPWLQRHDILSRGRFGAWRYEIGNMDHAVKMGIDAARLVAEGRPEELWAA